MLKRRKECIAMLLAGGQGSRLKVLTEHTAKPAIPFGGKYRIIDFPLSNCVNSGIDTVGILTQYQPLELNTYIENGQSWGLNRNFGGVRILPPYVKSKNAEWYKGTANAIYQNIHFIDLYDPEYVLVLSGDHIYKMDYSKMLKFHKKKKAECTIAVLDVPLEEASRFGIMNTDENDAVYQFEEKPKQPKSTKASMGVYLFNWRVLKKFLLLDEQDKNSSKDFGKNVIPALLADHKRLFAYSFDGYWKDVGTIYSLWEANMDLLNPNIPFRTKDPDFKIYAKSYSLPATFVATSAETSNCIIAGGSTIEGSVHNSIISMGCTIEEGAIVTDSVIMPNAVVESGAVVKYAIVGEGSRVGKKAKVGACPPENATPPWGISVVGHGKRVRAGATVLPDQVV